MFRAIVAAMLLSFVLVQPAQALVVCAKVDLNTGLPKEKAKLVVKSACTAGKEVPVGIQLNGSPGVDGEVVFAGVNVQVVNGIGATSTNNALGNLVVGYNEDTVPPNDRSGSHNLIVGREHTYSAFGGIGGGESNTLGGNEAFVVGRSNIASGRLASVSGGESNVASGLVASVTGGFGNTASNLYSWCGGGALNYASGLSASVSGGSLNEAFGDHSSVSGGNSNDAPGSNSSVSGGLGNQASAFGASVSGGASNWAAYDEASVSGGHGNVAGNTAASICGGYANGASGIYATVSGGYGNSATGDYASVSGGNTRAAAGQDDWVAGLLFQDN